MIPYRSMAIVFVVTALAYAAIGFAMFEMPMTLEEAEACGFTSADFTPAGQITYAPAQAWGVSFLRKSEYWSAASVGLAMAFMAFALGSARRIGGTIASGAAMGSGLLVIAAVCLGCVAPTLSIVGLGMLAGFMAGVPKWLVTLNTLFVVAWGTLFLSRRLGACPLVPPADSIAKRKD